jgi:ankyrin repeat protein
LFQQSGCELNAQDSDGWTALWHAYSNSSQDICAVLLRAGANKNILNNEGISIVEDAKSNEDEVMIELFQKFNALM